MLGFLVALLNKPIIKSHMIKGNINIKAITNILIENERRNSIIYAKFNPITGEGSVGDVSNVPLVIFLYAINGYQSV